MNILLITELPVTPYSTIIFQFPSTLRFNKIREYRHNFESQKLINNNKTKLLT